jgi:hypothetical protein
MIAVTAYFFHSSVEEVIRPSSRSSRLGSGSFEGAGYILLP